MKIDLERALKDPENRREFMAWALSDQEFLENFITLMTDGFVDGPTGGLTYPGDLDKVRALLHERMGDAYRRDFVLRAIEARRLARKDRDALWLIKHRLQRLQQLAPAPFHKQGSSGREQILLHGTGEPESCDICKFFKLLKEPLA